MIIYKIANLINGKVYIGQTTRTLKRRFTEHCSDHSKGLPLSKAVKKYGKENFIAKEIDTAETLEELNSKEERWVNFYNSIAPNGYNLKFGGGSKGKHTEETKAKLALSHIGNKNMLGKHHTEETKQVLREKSSGVKQSKETIAKRVEKYKGEKHWLYGKSHTEEAKKKISENKRGSKLSEETKRKISESGKGRVFSDERRKNISKSLMGKVVSEKARESYSRAFKGRKLSEETKRKISESGRGLKRPPRTEEQREKYSVSRKGKKDSEETLIKKRIASSNRSPESRKKLSESIKNSWIKRKANS